MKVFASLLIVLCIFALSTANSWNLISSNRNSGDSNAFKRAGAGFPYWTDSQKNFFGLFFDSSAGNSPESSYLLKYNGRNWSHVNADFGRSPTARTEAITWVDANDYLWLYGGKDVVSQVDLNDLWMFNASAWVMFDSTSTSPSSRSGSAKWVDSDHNLFIFGGRNNKEFLSDFWKFDGNTWTLISNPKNIDASSISFPFMRSGGFTWVDNKGHFWLFGGESVSGSLLNDFWKWNNTHWKRISGDFPVKNGHFGSYGVNSKMHPGSRANGASWIDSNNVLWLFGGYGYGESAVGILGDLWSFDGIRWTWISGPKNSNTVFPNYPSPRQGSASWTDNSKLFLFGGISDDESFSDMWEFYQTSYVSLRNAKRQTPIIFIGCWSDQIPQGRLVSVTADFATCLDNCSRINASYLFVSGQSCICSSEAIGLIPTGNLCDAPCTGAYSQYSCGGSDPFTPTYSIYSIAEPRVQWISSVVEFTSQSGNSAGKVIGPYDVFPSYADSSNAWAPIRLGTIDSLVLGVSVPVRIRQIEIFETLNPGTVTRVSSRVDSNSLWTTIWTGSTTFENLTSSVVNTSRIFIPDISSRPDAVQQIKIDFDTRGAYGIPQIDAVRVTGFGGVAGTIVGTGNATINRYGECKPGTVVQSINCTDLFPFYNYYPCNGNAWALVTRILGTTTFANAGFDAVSLRRLVFSNWTCRGVVSNSAPVSIITEYSGFSNLGSVWRQWINGYIPTLNLFGTPQRSTFFGVGSTQVYRIQDGALGLNISINNITSGRYQLFLQFLGQQNESLSGGRININDLTTRIVFSDRAVANLGNLTASNITVVSNETTYLVTPFYWFGGSNGTNTTFGNYGTRGVSSVSTIPGARKYAASWTDSKGNLWLFGGANTDTISPDGFGLNNDLWRYNGRWTWISGERDVNGYSFGNYGVLGVPSLQNSPPSRYKPLSWIDSKDNLFIFGGLYKNNMTNNAELPLGDLWMFNGTVWTWLWSTENTYPFYGVKNTPACQNHPGKRVNAVTWVDRNDNLWLWGGQIPSGYLDDMWRFDGNSWTWISGSNSTGGAGSIGVKGVPSASNLPTARGEGVFSWTDSQFNLYIFGGGIIRGSFTSYLSDLWKWDGTNWTILFGSDVTDLNGNYETIGSISNTTFPGGRMSGGTFIDGLDNLWIFGGKGYGSTPFVETLLNDLWRWDGVRWTWFAGSSNYTELPNIPSSSFVATFSISRNNSFYLFGGSNDYLSYGGSEKYISNELWAFYIRGINMSFALPRPTITPTRVTSGTCTPVATAINISPYVFVNGDNSTMGSGNYGTKGVASPSNFPGSRQSGLSWVDSIGQFWIMGGYRDMNTKVSMNDIWKFDGSSWTWVYGTQNTNEVPDGIYGQIGVANISNYPPARANAGLVKDSLGGVWVFGGRGRTRANGVSLLLSDLWSFDGTHWTWISGKDASFGIIEVPACSNYPRVRESPAMWMDNSSLWIFGGLQSDSRSDYGNDLWKFDGTYWTWMSGSTSLNDVGSYGTRGVASSQNVPPSRGEGQAYWTDSRNNFWLFGGYSTALNGHLDDLWRWNGNSWTWISGSRGTTELIFGNTGYSSSFFTPGSRTQLSSFVDWNNHLWIYGGITQGIEGGSRNDLWRYNGSAWTWVAGGQSQDIINVPPPRDSPLVSFDWTSRRLWIFGGTGTRNDLWYTTINEMVNASVSLSQSVSNRRNLVCPPDVYFFTTGQITSSPLTTQRITSSPLTTMGLTTQGLTTSPLTTNRFTSSPQITSGGLSTGAISTGGVTTSPIPTSGDKAADGTGSKVGVAVGAATAAGVFCVALILVPLLIYSRYRKKKDAAKAPINVETDLELEDSPPPPSKTIDKKLTESELKLSIPFAELEMVKEVGTGFFGDVFQAKWKKNTVAVKQITKKVSEKGFEKYGVDAEIMKKMKPHPNVVAFFGFCSNPLSIVTEFVAKGSLSSILASTELLGDETIIKILKGIASGMFHLSREKIVHRSLAARNVLITANWEAKVCDYALSSIGEPGHYEESEIGPIRWMAPESIEKSEFTSKSDVYSFGITILEIITRKRPFDQSSNKQVRKEVLNDSLNPSEEVPEEFSKKVKGTIKTCTERDPKVRPDFAALVDMIESPTFKLREYDIKESKSSGSVQAVKGSGKDVDSSDEFKIPQNTVIPALQKILQDSPPPTKRTKESVTKDSSKGSVPETSQVANESSSSSETSVGDQKDNDSSNSD